MSGGADGDALAAYARTLEETWRVMADNGWAVVCAEQQDGRNLCYTVGLTTTGWVPELVVRDIADPQYGKALLNEAAELAVRGRAPVEAGGVMQLHPGDRIQPASPAVPPVTVRLVDYPQPQKTLRVANMVYQDDDRWPGPALELVPSWSVVKPRHTH